MTLNAGRSRVANAETGELYYVEKEKRASYGYEADPDTGRRFTTVGVLAAKDLRAAEYTGATFRVLWHLIYSTDETRLIDQTQTEIAAETRLGQASVCRAMAQLVEDGYIECVGRRKYLNAQVSFYGTGAQHQQAIARMREKARSRPTVRHLTPVS